jgi:hypothetical protein
MINVDFKLVQKFQAAEASLSTTSSRIVLQYPSVLNRNMIENIIFLLL